MYLTHALRLSKIPSSSNNDILLHKSLSSNDLTNIDFAKEDEHKLITDFATFEKHTNISFQSCTTNIFLQVIMEQLRRLLNLP